MQFFLDILKQLNEAGIWSLLPFVIAAFPVSMLVVFLYKKRLPEFSVHLTYFCGNEHRLYPNTIHFEARNLFDSPVVISRPNFRFGKCLSPGRAAHGNSATGDYEIKFRSLDNEGKTTLGNSYTSLMLRHRESATAYIPFDDDLSEDAFTQLLLKTGFFHKLFRRNVLGYLVLNVVLLKETTPIVVPMKIPVINVSKRHSSMLLGLSSWQ